jgi:rhodanese-related sulfurtransferase
MILIGASLIGIAVNAGRAMPLTIFDPHGPGALPDEPRISLDAFKALAASHKNVIVLDVRLAETFRRGHPPDAIHVPENSFDESYQQQNLASILKSADTVVVFCDNSECPAADRAAKKLHELGHTNVRVLQDGWRGYLSAGLPIESGP